jgi:hypothetical protein
MRKKLETVLINTYAGTVALSPEAKQPGYGVNHSLPCSAEIKETVEIYILLSLLVLMACNRAKFTFASQLLRVNYMLHFICY